MLARPEFTRCYELGRKLHSARFIVFGLSRAPALENRSDEPQPGCSPGSGPSAGHDLPRLGLAVSSKVGSAVIRNRIKRVLREWFRLERGALADALGGVDLVLVAKRGLDPRSIGLQSVGRELTPVMRKLSADLRKGAAAGKRPPGKPRD